MKNSIFASLLLAAGVSAQYYNITSKPFQLVAHTHNETYNGTVFTPCHEGAAIEGLCVGPKNTTSIYSNFNFNTTVYSQTNVTDGPSGLLVWTLHGGNFNESEALEFGYNPVSNVAHPQLFPSQSGILLNFDAHNRLNVQGYIDDRQEPQTVYNEVPYYRWVICQSNAGGYRYTTLNWVMGDAPAQNPTCVKTQVVRRFVE